MDVFLPLLPPKADDTTTTDRALLVTVFFFFCFFHQGQTTRPPDKRIHFSFIAQPPRQPDGRVSKRVLHPSPWQGIEEGHPPGHSRVSWKETPDPAMAGYRRWNRYGSGSRRFQLEAAKRGFHHYSKENHL